MADAVLSSFLEVLFDKLLSDEFIDLFRGQELNEDLLRDLKMAFISLNKLVEDAEDKALIKTGVQEWLDELKDVEYEAGDILDEIATKGLRRKLDAEYRGTTSKVRNSISDFVRPFAKKIVPKIKAVLTAQEKLEKRKEVLGLKESGRGKPFGSRVTTSLVEESHIFGRNDDKEEIIKLLLLNNTSDNEKMKVIPIVALGGMGKTTLAQIIYGDKRVKEHFDLKAWVYVSEEFDVLRVTKDILNEMSSPINEGFENLNVHQLTLREKLAENRFLIVLDDMWNENSNDWELLSKPFNSGAQGSAVIITTRNQRVASTVRSVSIYHLNKLSEEDCWFLFAKYAFDNNNSYMRPKLEVIGRKIVKKCDGLPLAIKAIGHLLQLNSRVDEWEKILESNLWDLSPTQTDIHPSLRLSYKYLSPDLKLCFACLSIFPKSFSFNESIAIDLWMAEGLLKETINKNMEEVGHDYFAILTSMSLIQKVTTREGFFTMHDLVNDLTKSVFGQFVVRLVGGSSNGITKKTRHLSFRGKGLVCLKKSKVLDTITKLRTFISLNPKELYITNVVLHDLFPMMRNLRMLCLKGCINVTELPESIGQMKYLRCLNLSFTGITKLPNSICKLCNLQGLYLTFCKGLTMLPKDMQRLVNLHYLCIQGTSINEMPTNLGQLKQLWMLSTFLVSKHNGAGIQTLGKFANLERKLHILELQNVTSPLDALQARLQDKKNLKSLYFEWNSKHTSESQRSVLKNLEPHSNLKYLEIKNYCAASLPEWVGHSSFCNITYLRIQNCKYCCSLPPLGQLYSLQKLIIIGLEKVVKVDYEFYGNGFLSIKPFGALKVLHFGEMSNWEQWSSFGAKNKDGAFTQLEELCIISCPNLIGELPIHLPSLAKLEIFRCQKLVASLPKATAIQDLLLSCCNEVLLKELPTGLRRLRIDGFDLLECLPEVMINCSTCLQEFRIKCCLNLELSTQLKLSSLETLELNGCDSLTSILLDLFPKLRSIDILQCKNLSSLIVSKSNGQDLVIRKIHILDCPRFVSFPDGGLNAPRLTSFFINNCQSLGSLPDKMHLLLPSLKSFLIRDCPKVTSFPNGGFPGCVEIIDVQSCEKLFASRMEWGLAELLSLRYLVIYAKSEDVMSFPKPGLLPSGLVVLQLGKFQGMKSLDKEGLRHLTSLTELRLIDCPILERIPGKELLTSLSTIDIIRCPLLKKQMQRKKGKEQAKISEDVDVLIDGKYIG